MNSRSESFAATVTVVSSYLHYNQYPAEKLPELIKQVHGALCEVQGGASPAAGQAAEPAVPVERSVERDYIVCLEDGKRIRLLKRYLGSAYGMTPEQYRAKWGLPDDYPMVAPALSERRAQVAEQVKPHLKRKRR